MDPRQQQDPFDIITITPADPPPPAESGKPPVRQRGVLSGRVRVLALLLAVGAAIYLLAGYFLVPYLCRTWLVDRLGQQWGWSVTVARAGFNPLDLTLRLEQGRVGPAAGDARGKGEPLFTFARLELDFELASLWKRGPVVRELLLDRPCLRLGADHSFRFLSATLKKNLVKLLLGRGGDSAGKFSLNNIIVHNGSVRYHDPLTSRAHTLEVSDLVLPAVSSIDYRVAERLPFRFNGKIDGSPVELAGRTAANGVLERRLRLTAEDLHLPDYLEDLWPGVLPNLVQGRADCDLDLRFSFAGDNGLQLAVTGSMEFRGLMFQDDQGREAGRINRGSMTITAAPLRGRYRIERLALAGPELRVTRQKDGTITVGGIIVNKGEESTTRVLLEQALVEDGRLLFKDQAVANGFADTWDRISLRLESSGTGADRAVSVAGSARNSTSARLSLTGKLTPAPGGADLGFVVQDLDLSSLQPYWAAILFAGNRELRVSRGRARVSGQLVLGSDKGGQSVEAPLRPAFKEITATLADLVVSRGRTEVLRVPDLVVSGAEIDPAGQRVSLGTVRGRGGMLFLKRDPRGQWPGSGFWKKRADQGPSREPAWHVSVNHLAMDQAELRVEMVTGSVVSADEISLEYSMDPGASGRGSKKNGQLHGSARVAGNGWLRFSGPLRTDPFTAELVCNLEAAELALLKPLLAPWFQAEFQAGVLRASGTVRFPEMVFSGSAGIRGMKAAAGFGDGERRQEMLRWQDGVAEGVEAGLDPAFLRINRITVDRPWLAWIRTGPGRSSLTGFFVKKAGPFLWKTASPGLRIDDIRLEQGSLVYDDRTMDPELNLTISDLHGGITGLESRPDNRARFSLQALVADQAPLFMDGTVGFFDQSPALSSLVRLDDLDLVPFAANLAARLGWEVRQGRLAMDTRYRLASGRVKADNSLRIRGFELGKQLPGGDPGLPLTVALLTDREGVIRLDLPVAGAVHDPDISLRKSLARMVRNLVVKTVVSPFTLVREIFDNGQPVEQVFFAFGSSRLSGPARRGLRDLARLLGQRPRLNIGIRGLADQRGDREAILALREREAARQRLEAELRISEAITRKYGQEEIGPPGPIALQPEREKTAPTVTDRELKELARQRGLAAGRYLREELGVSADRLLELAPELVPDTAAGRPGNRVCFVPDR
ncbi:MAG: DUF748 domain-containing protein [Desulfobacterales bacterium]|nr:DUF748 domain-containing protein [Desulfobacterales bacterium]